MQTDHHLGSWRCCVVLVLGVMNHRCSEIVSTSCRSPVLVPFGWFSRFRDPRVWQSLHYVMMPCGIWDCLSWSGGSFTQCQCLPLADFVPPGRIVSSEPRPPEGPPPKGQDYSYWYVDHLGPNMISANDPTSVPTRGLPS